MRRIIAIALAAGTFGGMIGALATAAVQSDASPGAIAAAVQRVSDSSSEQSLRGINAKLGTVGTQLATLNDSLAKPDASLFGVQENLFAICEATAGVDAECVNP
jgi:hypothetical protein